MQFGNLLSTRTRRRSIFQANPFSGSAKNLYLFGGMIVSLLTALIILHVPFFNDVFFTRYNGFFLIFYMLMVLTINVLIFPNNLIRPVPIQFYFIPLGFATFILVMDETRKLLVRTYPKSFLDKLAW